MAFNKRKKTVSSTSSSSAIDTAENFADNEVEGGLFNLNLAGANIGNTNASVGKGSLSLGGGTGGNAEGGNSGVQVITTDRGAVDSAFGFAKLALLESGANSKAALDVISDKLSEKTNVESAVVLEAQNTRNSYLTALGLIAGAFVAYKIWGGKNA